MSGSVPKVRCSLSPIAVTITLLALTLLIGCTHQAKSIQDSGVDSSEVFDCPSGGCEVATDAQSMAILVLHQTDTPGDNGAFDSGSRNSMYADAVASGKILTVPSGTHARRVYQTQANTDTAARYSVVKILDGEYVGRGLISQEKYLTGH